jgi:hypothetical protein
LVDLLTIPVVHTGGVSRPLYTSKYWGPSDSEEEPEEEEEAEVEMLQHENVIDFTSLQAEELVPRAKLWTPTSKAKASARAAQGASSSSYLPSLVSTFDPLRFFHPPPGARLIHPRGRQFGLCSAASCNSEGFFGIRSFVQEGGLSSDGL